MNYTRKLLIVKIIGKIKLRFMNFRYVMNVHMTIMYTNFQMKLQVSLKVTVQLIYNDLKLAGCTKGGVVNIPTKFEVILKKLVFLVKFRHF